MGQTTLPLFTGETAENSEVEYKTAENGTLPKDTWHTVSAYANTDGGKIIFGINPDGQRIGLTRAAIDRLQLDIASLCEHMFSSTITPEIEYRDGLLVVYIPPSPAQLRPVYKKDKGAGTGTYVRIGSSNRLASSDIIQRFSVAARGGAETLSFPQATYKECLDITAVQEYIAVVNERKSNIYHAFSEEEILVKLRAITPEGYPTLFGLLAFGKGTALQDFTSPTMSIVITQYPGLAKVNEEDIQETYIDNREFVGSARSQFYDALLFIKSKMPVRGTIDSSGTRRDYLVIPEVALREALANAIAHRDYSTTSSPIQIDVFSNRIEFINPGNSLVPITEIEKAPSATRNPLLMSFLKDYGITDQKARGIRTIIVSLRKAGLLAPMFENIGASFKATLYASAFISSEDKAWLQQFSHFHFNERQLNALTHVRHSSSGISNSEYRNFNSMNAVRDDKKANDELTNLVKVGVLRATGKNRGRRYVLESQYQI